MGTWSYGILDDDVARDVHDRYLEAWRAGRPAETIVQGLLDEFAAVVADPDEGPIFWLAVAHAQWDCESVTPDVRERVEAIVVQGLGLARWEEAGRRELARRKAALSRFVGKIGTPRRRPQRSAGATAAVPFVVGDCLAIDLGDGHFGAAVVTKHLPGPSASHILSIVDFHDTRPPGPEVFSSPSWLPMTALPDLTIVKYCVYADGYRRHAARYHVICRIAAGEVPPPLTLGLANWGKVWQDLGGRLRQRTSERG